MANGRVKEIPEYLQPYIVQQDASLYTWIDQASWRFILKISKNYFKKHAHQKYLDGLRETGISSERIPLISEMSECLAKFGWQAVAVSGFIPPGVFMEFLALGVLPIACDMRKIENLAYTPAPDIVHEAAGHAPIVADPDFANYLLSYGELARKSIFSAQDMDVYHAIRNLSDIKENPHATSSEIADADARLDKAVQSVTYDSEATELSRMAWWTFEYGLVGDLSDPKIYGAGLLSSLGESYHCLSPEVKRVPFSLDCIHLSYDITKPQPQLFVAKDFRELTLALEELAKTTAFRRGGVYGLEKAKKAATVTTSEFSSGVQVSGVLTDFIRDTAGEAAYLQFTGPTQISFRDQEIVGQGARYHAHGFGTPVGILEDGTRPEDLTEEKIRALGKLRFKSGVEVTGVFGKIIRGEGKALMASFTHCTIRLGERILFQPAWGTFDLACGSTVRSVFGGAADRKEYLAVTGGFHQEPGKPKTNLTEHNRELNGLYGVIRELREKKAEAQQKKSEFERISAVLDRRYPGEWLLRYEMLEMASAEASTHAVMAEFCRETRGKLAQLKPSELIKRGLEVL
jgi:phenylalanine-4-hydroxylase